MGLKDILIKVGVLVPAGPDKGTSRQEYDTQKRQNRK